MSALGQQRTHALQQIAPYSITSSVNASSVGGATRADLPGGEPNLTERLPRVHTERLENFR
jgi:hypothetical protein